MSKRAPLEQRLQSAGILRRQAETNRLAAAERLHELVREGVEAGWSKTRIAEVAGLSRQTVHEILRN